MSKVILARLRADPIRVAEVAVERLPARPRALANAVAARPAVRKLARRVEGPLPKARATFQAGHYSEAIEQLKPYARNSFVRRRMAQYAGELASLSAQPIPPGPSVEVVPVPGRVLHCVTNALPYTQAGYTVRTHRIVTAQQAAGLDPHVVTSWGWPMLQGLSADAPASEEIDGIPYHRLLPSGQVPEESRGRMIRGAEEVTRLAQRIRPSVLHAATDHRNGSVALAVRERTGIPFVYEVRGFLEQTWLSRFGDAAADTERYILQREREAQVMRSADAVVTLAETMREEIVSRGVPRERIFLAPNAVDSALLSAAPDGAGFRERYGLRPDEVVVGSVSSIVAYEGFSVLLEAVALLRDQGTPVRLLLVGDGVERPALVRRVRELGLGDLAILPGRVSPEEALQAQAALDVFVTPRLDLRVCRLVTPLKPVEAMALGRPVVMSDLPALAELIGGSGAGLLVAPGDPAALAKGIAELRDDPDRRRAMGEAGREEVSVRRTWDRLAETYRDVYSSVINL
ncbi:glycosyltransferase family 4 protein [Rhizohabitans arisaemae]|uniref:glycosyltransferase family 4 protein n=1 Tax=Rhizohabitans arisaemae TaxID=2720610 RepID=UPI0024B0AAE6|nr:glycosyltransferase family 4 protein [Rhizohabitans arisaemae]